MIYKTTITVGAALIYLGIWVIAWFLGEHKPTYWEWFPQFLTAWLPCIAGLALILYADFNLKDKK